MRLVDARKKRHLSQAQAAKKIGISPSTLAMIEIGERAGTDETKRKIAKFYNLTVGYLFFGERITKRDSTPSNRDKETTK